jgi:ABC-type transport system substrate-binding protein
MKFKPAKYPDYPDGSVEGDLAESYELSPDKLQVTLKLRQGLKWDQRSPTNGRAIDASDIVFSWNKFAAVSPFASELAYAPNRPTAPIESVAAIDDRTIAVKLKQVDASILPLLGYQRAFFVMPKESESAFDPKGTVRGYGPWQMTDFRPSSLTVWSKNPDYYMKGTPRIDKLEFPIVPEYATQLSQFRAGGIYSSVVLAADIVQTKKDIPELNLFAATTWKLSIGKVSFGYEGDSPFKDVRVRQAAAMAFDREALADVIGNRQLFKDAGLPVETRYCSAIGPGWEGFWLDPTDEKKLGPDAKYWKVNIAEAKKLLNAAGFPNGFDTTFNYNGSTNYGIAYTRSGQTMAGMFPEAGIRSKDSPREYQNEWLPKYYYGYSTPGSGGNKPPGYNGMVWEPGTPYPTLATQLFAHNHKDGIRFVGMSATGQDAHLGDPQVNNLIEKLKQEFDAKAQQSLVKDFQQYIAKQMYYLPDYQAGSFVLAWPVVSNYLLWRNWSGGVAQAEGDLNLWLDETRPPIGKA